jgi:nicotinate-nucleotide adenylyltransferase
MDSLRELHRWNDPQGILELCTLVVVDRPGYTNPEITQAGVKVPTIEDKTVHIPGINIGISGSEIRWRISQGKTIRYWVPPKVEAYIKENKLYLEEPE